DAGSLSRRAAGRRGLGPRSNARRGRRLPPLALLTLRETLSAVRHVDHHAHSVLRADPADLDEFRGLFSESPYRRQWPHIATTVTFNRAIALLASTLGCAPNERAVFERGLASVPFAYAGHLM